MQLKLGLGFALLALSLNVFAQGSDRGGHDGGGGQGVVCYNNQNQIESVELLDIFEGRMLEGLNFPEQDGTSGEIFNRLIKKYPWYFSTWGGTENLASYLANFRFLPSGTRLKPIEDSNTIFIPSNCKIEQIVNFQGQSRIFVVKDFWDKMSPTNQAALYIHELIWHFERNNGSKYSSRARRTTARFFSDNFFGFKPIAQPPEGPVLECRSVDETQKKLNHIFWVDEKNCTLNFRYINNEISSTKHVAPLSIDLCQDIVTILRNPLEEVQREAVHINRLHSFLPVISEGEGLVQSHQVTINWDLNKPSNKLTIDVENLEFPGFDSFEDNLLCSTTFSKP